MERQIDVRDLAPPEPMEQVLTNLDEMSGSGSLRVYLSREPFPLYGILRDMECTWEGEWKDDRFELLIRPKPNQS